LRHCYPTKVWPGGSFIQDRDACFSKSFSLPAKVFRKKNVSTVSRGASTFSGRDNLFNVRFQERRTALRCRARHQMTVIVLIAVGLLGGGFMLYILLQWMRETVRNRNQ
jgi:hypothetical protein